MITIELRNQKQIEGLAQFCFDISKASFIGSLSLLVTQGDPIKVLTIAISSIFLGFIMLYFALDLLKGDL